MRAVPLLVVVFGFCFLLPPVSAQDDSCCESVREKDLPGNILRDQKFFWLRPFRPRREDARHWALVAGPTAALVPLDSPTARALAVEPPGTGHAFSLRVGKLSGGGFDLAVAGTFYLVGRARGDSRARETGLLGAQAVIDALMITEALKTAAGRSRPTSNRGRELIDDADGEFGKMRRSFPSGHALQAWALATVVAEQYRHNPWVRYSAFGLAGFVSVTRVTARTHFPSDIFVGSILGYWVGRHVARTYGCAAKPPEESPDRPKAARWSVAPALVPAGAALRFSYQF